MKVEMAKNTRKKIVKKTKLVLSTDRDAAGAAPNNQHSPDTTGARIASAILLVLIRTTD